MKKGLLFFLFIGLFVQAIAQDVIWTEDFSDGLSGWTVKSNACGNYSGGLIGEWTLTRAIIDDSEISGVTGTFSVGTDEFYQARFSSANDQLLVQGQYSLSGSTFTSNLNGETLDLMGLTTKTENNDTVTFFYSNLMTTQGSFDNLRGAVGVGSPTYTLSGQTLTLTSGNDNFTYQKSGNCGALWEWDHIGWVGDGALIFPQLASTSETGANGAAILNADYLTSKGVLGNIPDQPYPSYFSELISPTIDLSTVTTGVLISFYQLVRKLNENNNAPLNPLTGDRLHTSIAYSVDNGSTWSAPIDATEEIPVNGLYAGVDSFPLPNAILGQSEVKIKFTWAGDFYFWVLDDIQISTRPAFDMRVNENFLAYYPNFATPISQVDDAFFLADIQNVGASTADNVQLNLSITDEISGNTIYNSTISYGSIISDSLAENTIFPDKLEATALNSNGFAVYNGTYNVTFDGGSDLVPSNNISNFNFLVRDSIFSKENAAGLRTIAPADDNSYTWGNVFYAPNGDGYFARTIGFAIANPDELIGKSVTILLYEWDGDTNGDLEANPEEYGDGPIAFNSYVFDGSEVGNIIRLPIDVSEAGVPLKNGKHYIAMIQYFTEDDQAMFMIGSDEIDYSATWFVSDSLETPRYFGALEVGQPDAPSFSTLGFGRDIVPLVRLYIGDNPDLSKPAISMSTAAEEELPLENTIAVYPNPVEDFIQLEVELTEVSEKVQVNIFDQAGRAIFYREYDQIQQGKFDYDLSQLSVGMYYIKVRTEMGARTQKFIKK